MKKLLFAGDRFSFQYDLISTNCSSEVNDHWNLPENMFAMCATAHWRVGFSFCNKTNARSTHWALTHTFKLLVEKHANLDNTAPWKSNTKPVVSNHSIT